MIIIIYLVVDMQNLHGLIWMTSQSPMSARRAKNAYPISSRRAKMHILDVIMENYIMEDRPVELPRLILSLTVYDK